MESAYTTQLKQYSAKRNDIRIICNCSQEEKASLLQLCNVLVLPSKEESFGVVLLEAWSFKKPVIGAHTGAIASVISEGEDGFLFTPDDAAGLCICLIKLKENSALQKAMGEKGYEKVLSRFTWDKIGAQFRQVYTEAQEIFKDGVL